MSIENLKVMVITESFWESIVRDIVTFAAVVIPIGIGNFVGSSAMEWAGFILTAFFIMGRLARLCKEQTRFSPAEAAAFLRDKYGVTASESD